MMELLIFQNHNHQGNFLEMFTGKGFTLRALKLECIKIFDATNQLEISKIYDFDEDLSVIMNYGLIPDNFKYSNSINNEEGIFNSFNTDLSTTISIIDNHVETTNSSIKGSIKIPIVSKVEDFTFKIQRRYGLQDGFLNEDLTQRTKFNDMERKMSTFKQGSFSENNHLKFEIDFEVPALNLQLLV